MKIRNVKVAPQIQNITNKLIFAQFIVSLQKYLIKQQWVVNAHQQPLTLAQKKIDA